MSPKSEAATDNETDVPSGLSLGGRPVSGPSAIVGAAFVTVSRRVAEPVSLETAKSSSATASVMS